LNGTVDLLRVYDRALMHTDAIANWRNASGISGPAVSAEAPRLASPQSLLTTPYPLATPVSARSEDKLIMPVEPTTQVTLPAQLPLKPDTSF
jgi:hypothetical protein